MIMAIGETLLKITDYPFAYSLIGILTLWIGIDVSDDQFVYLLAGSGSIGTLLVISNPIGRYLASTLKHNFGRRKIASFQSNQSNNFKYCIHAIETNSIKTEINKIVSLMYFALIIALFGFAVGVSETVSNSFVFYQEDNIPLCDSNCLQLTLPFASFFFLVILIIVLVKDWPKVIRYAEIAGIYQLSISSEFVTSTSRSNMGRSIEQNDWRTAEEWAKIIETEIKTEKGKKDFNMEAIRDVYRPLYEESIQNEVATKNILNNNLSTTFSSSEWDSIQSLTKQLVIKDKELLGKIKTLYGKIHDYNQYPPTLQNQIKEIIQKEASSFYGLPVINVSYFYQKGNSGNAPALWDCLRTGEHPSERYGKDYDFRYVSLELSNNKHKSLKEEKDLKDFEDLWKILVESVKTETSIPILSTKVHEIQKLNNELKPLFEEQIKKQWL